MRSATIAFTLIALSYACGSTEGGGSVSEAGNATTPLRTTSVAGGGVLLVTGDSSSAKGIFACNDDARDQGANCWRNISGKGLRISSTSIDTIWSVGTTGIPYELVTGRWVKAPLPGGVRAVDIGVATDQSSGDSKVFAVTANRRLYQRIRKSWSYVPTLSSTRGVKRVAVESIDAILSPIVIGRDGRVFSHESGQWTLLHDGPAADLSAANGYVLVIADAALGEVHRMDRSSPSAFWESLPMVQGGHLVSIASDNDGNPFVTNQSGHLFEFDPSDSNNDGLYWTEIPGAHATDIAWTNRMDTHDPPCGDWLVQAKFTRCTNASSRSACVAAGGAWGKHGLAPSPYCLCPTGQDDCPCRDSSSDCFGDCNGGSPNGGECVADSGYCADTYPLVGDCFCRLSEGVGEENCVD